MSAPSQPLLHTQTFPVSSSVPHTQLSAQGCDTSGFSVCELNFQGRQRHFQRAASILSDPPHSPIASGWQ